MTTTYSMIFALFFNGAPPTIAHSPMPTLAACQEAAAKMVAQFEKDLPTMPLDAAHQLEAYYVGCRAEVTVKKSKST